MTTDISITDLFEGDLQLASPPNLFFELKKVLEDPGKSLADAGNVIINDPALAMRLLKLVNSAYFGFPGRIATVTHAIAMVGSRDLENLVLATLIINKFSSQPNGMMTMHDFWAAGLRSALLAKALALALPSQITEDKESVFICGLLHDIGKLVFYRRIPEITRQVGLLVEQTGESEADIEQKILGFDHYDTGAELARLWHLPAIISETIGQHCKPDKSSPYCLVADLVRSANLASQLDLSEDAFEPNKWGISDEGLSAIIDNVQGQFDELFSIFYPVLRFIPNGHGFCCLPIHKAPTASTTLETYVADHSLTGHQECYLHCLKTASTYVAQDLTCSYRCNNPNWDAYSRLSVLSDNNVSQLIALVFTLTLIAWQ